jgi:indole-3-glycerol phosphate synthase
MILDDIVTTKRDEIVEHKRQRPLAALADAELYRAPRRGFAAALAIPGRAIIAEVKKASPSRGLIRADFDPRAIAQGYQRAGARAISVLTDAPYFQGSLAYLEAIRHVVDVPLLRKDFVLDPYQIHEARAFGADAVLLICAILGDGVLEDLLALSRHLGLDALVEVHSEEELERATGCGASLIGINNRDLRTFVTRLEVAESLARLAPAGAKIVAESGLKTAADLERLEAAGVRAFLIGETLMAAPDPEAALRALSTRTGT